ncbi:monocarboxylate transporter 9-like isoform X2 [Mercenaria mercenaria]|uniref:monocarboxylate transporter 9-like isoform X2 n=1 Tax=Mercenaria mercenaria TaxID=6596 RepID=UPI00234E697B|nr:monocarboxylate transporter 9-like isoform X2 [Mercenaria mercenaria]
MTNEKEEKEKEALTEPDHVHGLPDDRDDFSDLDTGWAWMVLLASFGTFFLIGNSMYAVGIIHSSLLDRYGEKVTLTSWAGALHTALMSLGGPLSTVVIDRFSCRTAITASGMFFVVGYLGTAFAETIETAIFTCGILAGTGAALGYTAAMVAVGFNFRRRRNLALGIAVSGVGAGLFVLAPLMQLSREFYGPMGFFIILAAMTANIVTFGQLCFPSIVVDAGGTYELSLIVAAVCIVLGMTFSAVTMCCKETNNDAILHIEETIEIPEKHPNNSATLHEEDKGSFLKHCQNGSGIDVKISE